MYKKICDRCNKDITNIDNEITFTKIRNTRYGYDKAIHLCDECLVKFNKFVGFNNKRS